MAKTARSARGEMVDFDILAIKQQLASAPVSINTEERRVFIDAKNGVKYKNKNANQLLTLQQEVIHTSITALQDQPEVLKAAMEPMKRKEIKNTDEDFDSEE